MGSTSCDRGKDYKCNNFSLTITIGIHKLTYINFVNHVKYNFVNHVKSYINEGYLHLFFFFVSITVLKEIAYTTII